MANPIKDVGNGFDPDRVGNAVKAIEAIDVEIASMTGEHMAKCKVKRGEIADIKKEAKTAWGIPKAELNVLLKERALQRKIDAARIGLDDDQQDNVVLLAEALGKAAVAKAANNSKATGASVSA